MANEKKKPQTHSSSGMDVDDIAVLLETLEKHEVTEFRLEREGEKVWLKRGAPAPTVISQPAAPIMHAPVPSHVAPQQPQTVYAQPPQAEPQLSVIPKEEPLADRNLKEIRSPMVGTFYRRPAVDAEPYVEVGDSVKKGAVLCIIEAMKLMNEIETDIGGKIAEVCLEDGQMVEYGEVLFKIETL